MARNGDVGVTPIGVMYVYVCVLHKDHPMCGVHWQQGTICFYSWQFWHFFRWGNHDYIKHFFFNYVEFKLPFTWALAIWRLLSGNVAFRDIAEIYSLWVPLYSGGGTVHPSLTKERTIYSSDFILIRNSALLCWSGPWKNNILCSIWWTLTWSTRWDWYSTETDCCNLAKTR